MDGEFWFSTPDNTVDNRHEFVCIVGGRFFVFFRADGGELADSPAAYLNAALAIGKEVPSGFRVTRVARVHVYVEVSE
jgi:hypothetical protein